VEFGWSSLGPDRVLWGRKKGVVFGVGQERPGPSYFFISSVLGPLLHIISARPSRPSKQPLMVRTFLKVYVDLGSYFVSATRTNKRHHHHLQMQPHADEDWAWEDRAGSGPMLI
jgi:hypothetical protein